MAIDFEDTPNRVIVNPRDANKVVVREEPTRVQIAIGGPQGIAGPAGAAGATGATGAAGGSYTHTQNAVSYIWTITHNLGYYQNITTTDATGFTIEGTVEYTALNTATITFSFASTGFAYLS
jgi:hypothetical protein